MINQWKIPEKGGVGKSVPEKCKSPLTFTLKQFSLNSVLLVIVNSLNKKHVGKPISGQFCFIKNSTIIRKGRVAK